MSATQLAEKARELLLSEIKANIAAKLAAIRVDRADAKVTTEPPRSYFIFDGALTYQCPAVFVVIDSINLPDDQTGPNFLNARIKAYCSVVVEDREEDFLTIKTERYQAALFEILHWRTLVDSGKNVKAFCRILNCQFSPLYTQKRGNGLSDFRKEVALELELKQFENPTS